MDYNYGELLFVEAAFSLSSAENALILTDLITLLYYYNIKCSQCAYIWTHKYIKHNLEMNTIISSSSL